jgi:type IV pilus assembly protein PilC
MPLFRYTVEDKSGKTLNGVMQAADEADLANRLTFMGYSLRAASPAGPAPAASATAAPSVMRSASVGEGIPPSLEPRVSLRTLATYLRQMAALIRSGLAPYQATHEILGRTSNSRLRRALQSMESQVQSGGSLSPVMTAYPDVFPTKIVGLIYCGELGGFLDTALDEAATSVETEAKQRLFPKMIAGFMRLNVIGLILSIPFLRLDLILVRLAKTAKPGDQVADSIRNAMNALKAVFLSQAPIVITLTVLFIAATYAWPHVKRIPSARAWMDAFVLKMPIWGPLQMSRSLARFGESLGQLYSAGISPGPAWIAASSTCQNSVVANKIRFAGAALASGGTFSTAVQQAGVFDENVRALLISGERAGDIPGMLRKVTQFQEELAAAQHTKGRWLSTSFVTSALLAMGGLTMILMVRGYVGGVFKAVDALMGGPQ